MLKVIGRDNSSNVMKVVWACAEIGVPFERVDMGGEFGMSAEYLAMNPNARVPSIIDGDFSLWESNAIVRYLAQKHSDGGLWPADVQLRADMDRWMDWQQTTLGPAFRDVFWGLVRTPEAERNYDAINAAVNASAAAFRILDHKLEGRDYLGGSELTMGDIPFCGFVHRWFGIDIDGRPDDMPNLRAWYDRLCQRPAFRTHIADIPIA